MLCELSSSQADSRTQRDLMFLALGTRRMWGACTQQWGSTRSSQRSPRRQNLSCSTCLDHPRTVWATKTVSCIRHTTYCVSINVCVPSSVQFKSLSHKSKFFLQQGSIKAETQWKHHETTKNNKKPVTTHAVQNTIKGLADKSKDCNKQNRNSAFYCILELTALVETSYLNWRMLWICQNGFSFLCNLPATDFKDEGLYSLPWQCCRCRFLFCIFTFPVVEVVKEFRCFLKVKVLIQQCKTTSFQVKGLHYHAGKYAESIKSKHTSSAESWQL